MRRRAGSISAVVLLAVLGLVALGNVGLMRSSFELTAARQQAAKQRAFYLAEGGIDRKIAQIADGVAGNDDDAIPLTTLGAGRYKVDVTDIGGGLWRVVATGISGGRLQRLAATIEPPTAPPPSPFDYASASDILGLSGGATIGDLSNRVKIHVSGGDTSGAWTALASSANNELWLSHIDFVNPNNLPIEELCPRCADASVFHPPFTYNLQADPLPDPQLDLMPYYQEALAQDALLVSRGLTPYHHISADRTFTDETLEGVIYVECQVKLTFTGTSVVKGTIVHEGCNGDVSIGTNSALTIDSAAPTDLNGDGIKEPPFAKGLAIIGAPDMKWPGTSTVDVRGFVMVATDDIAADGSIAGGILGVRPTWYTTDPELWNNTGPGAAGLINFGPLKPNSLKGPAQVVFTPLEDTPPGFPSASRPTSLVSWESL